MTEWIKEMNKTGRLLNAGAIAELFQETIEHIAKLAVEERIDSKLHNKINPILDEMICQLNEMKNNVLGTMMTEGKE